MLINKRTFVIYIKEIKKHVNIQKLLSCYIQHGTTNTYVHSRNVAYMSYYIAKFFEKKLGLIIDYDVLIVGALFHDFFLYDWHDSCSNRPRLHGFRHPHIASINAEKYFDISIQEKLIIETHMWPLTITKFPKTPEAKIVCLADKLCSTHEILRKR